MASLSCALAWIGRLLGCKLGTEGHSIISGAMSNEDIEAALGKDKRA